MRATKLQELEGMAAKLLAGARKLPAGQERRDILLEIGRFRSQIVRLQRNGIKPPRVSGRFAPSERLKFARAVGSEGGELEAKK
jgi:hypothetical protein